MGHDPIARLTAAALDLNPADLARFLDMLAGSPEVAEAGFRIRERRLSVERFPDRNQRIRKLAKRLSYAQIGRLFGMSRHAVRNIIKRPKGVNTKNVCTPSNGYDS